MGVTIRHWFNTHHARKGNPHWTWAVTLLIFIAIVWLSVAPAAQREAVVITRFAEAKGFTDVHDIVLGRCSMCHAAEPVWSGLLWAPRGVALETEADLTRHARAVYLQAGISHAMPPANLSYMQEDERAAIVAWYRAAIGG
jgi:uncharacterized membrane protein